MNTNVFGVPIRRERELFPMTVESLSALSGLEVETINKIEEGSLHPNVKQIFAISKALGKMPGHFFTKLVR